MTKKKKESFLTFEGLSLERTEVSVQLVNKYIPLVAFSRNASFQSLIPSDFLSDFLQR